MKIVVQAGGRGSRLRHHTWNKPKCLVSVGGKPILYGLFDRFPDSEFVIIGDYLFDKLESYLKVNPPPIKYTLIKAKGKGTCSGIKDALEYVDGPFWLVWSDLIVDGLPEIDETDEAVVSTTRMFTCRWSVNNGKLIEKPIDNFGVPGLFYFSSPSILKDIPEQGEFVKWLSVSGINYKDKPSYRMQEMGEFKEIERNNDEAGFCRFFNVIAIQETTVKKQAIVDEYSHLLINEQDWYEEVRSLGFKKIPEVISREPYVMSRLKGVHAYQGFDYSPREKRAIIYDFLDSLSSLHSLGSKPANLDHVYKVYIDKTKERVESVKDLIPNFDLKSLTVNGKKVENIFHNDPIWGDIYNQLIPSVFTPIHGDPNFSNAIVDHNLKVSYIDPRGYFYEKGIWGDPLYDFAKVYYSAVGNYDLFNRRKFKVHIDNETVEVLMEESKFISEANQVFHEFFSRSDIKKIKLLHGLIWLALSGYARDDIDSVIGSFYLGLYWLEEGLNDTF